MQLLGNLPEVMSLLFRYVATRCFARSYVKLLPVRLSRSVGLTDVSVTPNSNGSVHGSDTEEKRGVARGEGALCAPHSNYLFWHKSHYQLQLQNWLRPTFTTPSLLRPFDATRTVRTSTCTRVYQTQFKKKKNCFNQRETHLAGLSLFRCRYKIVRRELWEEWQFRKFEPLGITNSIFVNCFIFFFLPPSFRLTLTEKVWRVDISGEVQLSIRLAASSVEKWGS